MYPTWVEVTYANLVGAQLERFKVKNNNPYLANFRCPICGDSAKNKTKSRGYIYQVTDRLRFQCHNCGASHAFPYFLKIVSTELYDDFMFEKYKNTPKTHKEPESPLDNIVNPGFPEYLKKGKPLTKLKKISQLEWNHPAKEYVLRRKIPNFYHSRLFFAPKFNKWINTMVPNKLDENRDDERLVIPFFDEEENLVAVTGRAIDPNSEIRYISITLDQNSNKLYGIDLVDRSKDIYVLEGPIDSMFIPNSVATADSNLQLAAKMLPKDNLVLVYDNQPRNKDIVKQVRRAILNGFRVYIPPSNIEAKDMNDLILSGMDSEDIVSVINTHTYTGLMAEAKFTEWKKV